MADSNQTRTLKPFDEKLTVGEALTHRNLCLRAIHGVSAAEVDYMLCSDAIADGLITISEVSAAGSVPELLVTSRTKLMVLLLDGEELIGAKQNRILNTTVMLPGNAKTTIPVSCVEQGRWRHTSATFTSGGYSPSTLRGRKSKDVGENLRRSGRAQSDQGAVWDEVGKHLFSLQASSPTMAMNDAVNQRRDSLDDFIRALPYPKGARGVFVAINGRFVAMDLFDKPRTLERIWGRLVTGYAMDALGNPGNDEGVYSEDRVNKLLSKLQDIECTPCPTVGVGEDWRFENERIVGQALIAEEQCIHLSVFPNDRSGAQQDVPGSRIAPPSRRRRNRPEDEPRVD